MAQDFYEQEDVVTGYHSTDSLDNVDLEYEVVPYSFVEPVQIKKLPVSLYNFNSKILLVVFIIITVTFWGFIYLARNYIELAFKNPYQNIALILGIAIIVVAGLISQFCFAQEYLKLRKKKRHSKILNTRTIPRIQNDEYTFYTTQRRMKQILPDLPPELVDAIKYEKINIHTKNPEEAIAVKRIEDLKIQQLIEEAQEHTQQQREEEEKMREHYSMQLLQRAQIESDSERLLEEEIIRLEQLEKEDKQIKSRMIKAASLPKKLLIKIVHLENDTDRFERLCRELEKENA